MTALPLNHTREQASEYLRARFGIPRSPATLAKLAVIGGGPRFHKAGRRALYPREALDAWARALLGETIGSTSEARGKSAT